MALALAVYTFANKIFPTLLLMRLLFALGGSASSAMLTATLSDFGNDNDRGKLAGLVGLCSGLGALVALLVLLPLPSKFHSIREGLYVTYLVIAGVTFAFSILLFFALRHEKDRTNCDNQENNLHATDVTCQQDTIHLIDLMKNGFTAAVHNPNILVGYLSAFLARGDTIIITLFLPLWVYKSFIDSGKCSVPDPVSAEG